MARALWSVLPRKQRVLCLNFFCFTIISGLLDALSIITVIPLINILLKSKPSDVSFIPLVSKLPSNSYFVLIFLCLAAIVVFSTFIKVFIIRKSLFISADVSHYVSSLAHEKVLHLPYEELILSPKGELIAALSSKLNLTSFFITFFLQAMAFVILALIILLTIFVINPGPLLLSGSIFVPSYFLFSKLTKSRLLLNSKNIANALDQQVTNLKNSFDFLLEIKLYDLEDKYIENYNKIDASLRSFGAESSFLATFPKYTMEAIGYLLLAGIALADASLGKDPNEIFSMLSLLAIGTSKLLPYLQQIYSSLSLARSNTKPTLDVLYLIGKI